MTRDNAKQEIRRNWRQIIPAITGPAKQPVNGETSWICPLCGHGTHGDGLTRNPQSADGTGLKCFGCGFSGDIIDLQQQTTGKDFKTALEDLAQIAGIALDDSPGGLTSRNGAGNSSNGAGGIKLPLEEETPQRAEKRPTEETTDFTAYYAECRRAIEEEPAAAEYLAGRGIIGPALFHGAGFDKNEQRIVIPCSPRFYIARAIDPSNQFRYKNPKGTPAEIFNEAALYDKDNKAVFITEGIFDALSVIEVGGQAIALNSINNARALIEKLEQRPTEATLIISLDNDKAGERAAQKVQEDLKRLKIPFITADIAAGHKDANEALIADRAELMAAVMIAEADAEAYKEKRLQEAQQAELERQKRTGEGMIDAFLETVRTRRYEPIPTTFEDLDRALSGGFTRQTLVLLGGSPGIGKTAFTVQLFETMAQRGTACLYLNLEMSREQLLARSLSRIAAQHGDRISSAEIKRGYAWTVEQEEAVTIAATEYKKTIAPRMVFNPDGIGTDLDSILAYIEEEAARAEEAGMQAPLVVIDYLQIITGREREDETALIKRAVGSFKRFAIQHNTLVCAVIAHNRAANQSGTVTQESGRDTSALEYSADLQLGLAFTKCLKRTGFDRKAKEDLTPEEMKLITLKVTKGRDAKIGAEVDLYFNGETMTYTTITDQEEPQESTDNWNWNNAIKK